jgi:hypothetical protein
MTMGEFSTLLERIDGLHAKVETLACSQAGCQVLCADLRRRRRGWVSWLGGAVPATAAVFLGFYLRR